MKFISNQINRQKMPSFYLYIFFPFDNDEPIKLIHNRPFISKKAGMQTLMSFSVSCMQRLDKKIHQVNKIAMKNIMLILT